MKPTIVALGGGGFSNDPEAADGRRLDQVILDATGKARPKLCFIGTAGGDADSNTVNFYRAFAGRAETSDLNLFWRSRHHDLREFILGLDAVYVGGGSTLNMVAIWRAHGLDAILREAWQAGVVMAGMSAGMVCWFERPVTDAFHDGLIHAIDGLGFLPGSACAHYGDAMRRATYPRMIKEGLAAGHAAEDGVALVFHDTTVADVVASTTGARAFFVDAHGERELPARSV